MKLFTCREEWYEITLKFGQFHRIVRSVFGSTPYLTSSSNLLSCITSLFCVRVVVLGLFFGPAYLIGQSTVFAGSERDTHADREKLIPLWDAQGDDIVSGTLSTAYLLTVRNSRLMPLKKFAGYSARLIFPAMSA